MVEMLQESSPTLVMADLGPDSAPLNHIISDVCLIVTTCMREAFRIWPFCLCCVLGDCRTMVTA